jgi:signal transduction histidine kinase
VGLWQAVVFAGVIVALLALFAVVALIRADNIELRRYKIHDLNNELLLIRGSLDLLIEMTDDPPKRLLDLQDSVVTLCALAQENEERRTRIRLRRYLRAMVARVCCVHGEVIECDDPADPRIEVVPIDLRRLLLNLLLNAVQARETSGCEDLVQVTLAETYIQIRNPAKERDRKMVLRRSGSTKGVGRGSGRGSIARSARILEWSVQFAVDGQTVVVTLRWGRDGCYAVGEDEEGKAHAHRPEERPN